MDDTSKILVASGNPRDVEPHELTELAAAICALQTGYEVEIPPPPYHRGAGVTWWEVVRISVPWDTVESTASNVVLTQIAVVAVDWMRERFKQRPTRPKVVTIDGPKGEELKTVALKSATGDPEDEVT